jgi:hypothetical protein
MWNVNQTFAAAAVEKLPALGFHVGSTGGVVRVEKYDCGAEFRRAPGDTFRMTIAPTLLLEGQFTRLWDAGYQKFLITDDGRKVPALQSQLRQMRRFNEELRSALGVPVRYNEALGSTCQVTAYDRLTGEPGAVPDRSVGVKADPGEHEI